MTSLTRTAEQADVFRREARRSALFDPQYSEASAEPFLQRTAEC
jgi:hypothetical protein